MPHTIWLPIYIDHSAPKLFKQGNIYQAYVTNLIPVFFHSTSNFLLSRNMDGKKLEYKGEEALKELERQTKKPDEVQQDILRKILAQNWDTEYLKKHMGKSTKSVSHFKKSVPAIMYKDIRPYIVRIANGENSSLITGQPITEMLCRYVLIVLIKFGTILYPKMVKRVHT